MRIGCQTFTWEMLGPAYRGGVADMIDAIAEAGYAGVEISNNMIGGYDRDPDGFKAVLVARRLAFIAYAFSVPSGFTVAEEQDADLAAAAAALEFLSHFPRAVLSLGCPTDVRGIGDIAAVEQAAKVFNRIGALGQERGIPVAVHPSSHHGSAVVTRSQYERLMAETDPALIRWVPDTGHIIRGRQDVRETLSLFADRIIYVHLKDADRSGAWQMMGAGDCGILDVVAHLRQELGFDGWLVAEEESPTAETDPTAAIRANRDFLLQVGI
jgi:inosose dehydratase